MGTVVVVGEYILVPDNATIPNDGNKYMRNSDAVKASLIVPRDVDVKDMDTGRQILDDAKGDVQ